jgi:superfamily II DNA or RNA helicase
LAALEWSLADSIVIHRPEDIQSRATWQDGFEPFHHQVTNLFTFCRRLPVALLADDVGLGKTISAGLILSELVARRRVRRALVLCPKILGPQWAEELQAKFGLTARAVAGGQLAGEVARQTAVVITTYETARNHLARLPADSFDMLILDEAHKLKNLYAKDPPDMARKVRGAPEERLFKYVVMLTATPIHNGLWDVYSLLDCLTAARGHANPLGLPDDFKRGFLLPGHDGRRLNPAAADRFRGILRDYLVRTRRGDARLAFPEREVRLLRVELSPPERQLTDLVARHIDRLGPLQQTSLAQALMSSPQALAAQMENMARTGSLPPAAASAARSLADTVGRPAKLGKLLSCLGELKHRQGEHWRAVVFTRRKETQHAIGEALQRAGVAAGFIRGGEARQNQAAIERFRAKPPGVHVLVSTDAGAEGINLQVANFLVNYDLPWNPMVVEQRIGRLQRLNSEHRHVAIVNLVAAGSVEERIVAWLLEKLQAVAQALGDVESILESAGWEGDGPDQDSFESRVRELVVKALLGQDVAEALRRTQESIERARSLMEERRRELDATLGPLDALHTAGPGVPALTRACPAVPARDFVLRARRAEGARVEARPDGMYEVSQAGRPWEVVAFEEADARGLAGQAVFQGNVRLYQPGRPAFERLVQHWVDHCGHLVRDLTAATAAQAEQLARLWCRGLPGAEFRGCKVTSRQEQFQGRVAAKVQASNGVDRYEKLVWREFQPGGHLPVTGEVAEGLIEQDVVPSRVLPGLAESLGQAVGADQDVREFCRFYSLRLQEEVARAGDDARRRHKVNADFSPSVTAEVVGVRGAVCEEVVLSVSFTLDGRGPYEATLQAVPASGQVLGEPPRAACQVTNRVVPESCLGYCVVSKRRALSHLLVTSEESKRQALAVYAAACQLTGRTLLEDEVGVRALTGHKVLLRLLRSSVVSGRLGVAEDFARCEFTGKEALRDEVLRSQVSGKPFLAAEAEQSAVSGKVGHRSEFVICQATGMYVLPAEAGTSAVSQRVVRKDLLRPSEKAPGRLGLEEEFGTCEVSGKQLLRDELSTSAVSGKVVDRDLLGRSDRSGGPAAEDELVRCEESGANFLPSETGLCTLTHRRVDDRLLARSELSGRVALSRLLQRCAATNKLALPGELEQCQESGHWAVPAELGTCAVTGKRVLRSLLVTCRETGDSVLRSAAGRSDYSGEFVRPELLVASARPPGRVGLARECGLCEVTGGRLLLDELGVSAVSGKRVDSSQLRPSDRSGELALAEELVVCQESGSRLLPGETGVCTVTGWRVDS